MFPPVLQLRRGVPNETSFRAAGACRTRLLRAGDHLTHAAQTTRAHHGDQSPRRSGCVCSGASPLLRRRRLCPEETTPRDRRSGHRPPWPPALPSPDDRLDHLLVRRMASRRGLRVDEPTVGDHLEAAAARALQLNGGSGKPCPERRRQTDGLGPVVSEIAVFDGYPHVAFPQRCVLLRRVASESPELAAPRGARS